MQTQDFIYEARHSSSGLPSSPLLQMITAQKLKENQRAELRLAILEELYPTLTLTDRPFIRFLLQQEILCREEEYETTMDGLYLCGFLLFLLAQLEDVELLWEAKTTNFDTYCGFDIQYLVSAGVSQTLAYLQTIQQPWATDAQTYIQECQQTGDFNNLAEYRQFKPRYFFGE